MIEKIIKALEEQYFKNRHELHDDAANVGIDQAIGIVRQVATEHNNGCIPPEDKEIPCADKECIYQTGNCHIEGCGGYVTESEE